NNVVEQDHRFIKKRVRSMLGFKSFGTATCILAGVEAMHMIKKEQVDLQDQFVRNQKEFIHGCFCPSPPKGGIRRNKHGQMNQQTDLIHELFI
ncbi:DDE-type integrase/transposase/recombinase, partial [Bacillus wiedmannii]|uniref:DDE-type integrase/transposase/recombinase n=1 Tax=Bacillus wiedmannii TaxID=1890302 RepID=UPI00272F95F1